MKSQTKRSANESGDDLYLSDALGKLGKQLLSSSSSPLSEELVSSVSIFDVEPVDIETFLYGPGYLNLSLRLSPPQIDFVDNCSRLFDEPIYTEGVLQCGQGSGKDTCSVFLCLRMIYLLSCLTSPQKYFRMGEESFIDLINIAPNAESAKNIFFDTLSNYMWNGPIFSRLKPKDTRKIVTFPKNIRLISGNSEDESWQGYNPILVVLDEIDAFKSEAELQRSHSLRSEGAGGIYGTAKSLVQSRFPSVGKVLCLSWPRFKGSFIQQRFDEGKSEPKTYVAQKKDGAPYATWEFNPVRTEEDFADFFKQDPILANARFKCLAPGTLIATNDGFKKIEDVQIGNYVLSHNNYQRVTKVFKQKYTGGIVAIRTRYGHTTYITPEHPVYAICNDGQPRFRNDRMLLQTPQWVAVGKLRRGDVVLKKFDTTIKDCQTLDLTNYWSSYILDGDEFIYAAWKNPSKKNAVLEKHPDAHRLSRYVNVSEEFLELAGLYLAEGYIGARGGFLGLTFGKHETRLISRAVELFDIVFGVTAHIREVRTAKVVGICSKIIVSLFIKEFGQHSYGKNIPNWILHLPVERQLFLINGYMAGDGYFTHKGGEAATVSSNLAYSLYTLLLRQGYICSIEYKQPSTYCIEGRTGKTRLTFKIRYYPNPCFPNINQNGFVFLPVSKTEIQQYDGDVYNIEVGKDNSYTTDFATVHNCSPPFSRDAFIKNPDFILSSFDAYLRDDKIFCAKKKPIRNEYTCIQGGTLYYIHVDLGLRHANAALGMAHREENRVVIDLIRVWEPRPGMDIDFKEIENFILGLRKLGYHIDECTYDHYQSVSSMQSLNKAGIPTAYKSLDRGREVWDTFKDLLYQHRIDGYFDEPTIRELLGLDLVYGDKIEARPGALKDRADAVAGAVHGAMKAAGNVTRIRTIEMSTFFSDTTTSPFGLQKGEQSVAEMVARKTDINFRRQGSNKATNPNQCPSCKGVGSMEYRNDGGRTVGGDDANARWCLACGGRWSKNKDIWVEMGIKVKV